MALSVSLETMKVAGTLYCPNCSAVTQGREQFCSSCGVDMQPVRQVISGNAPKSWLRRQLDRSVREESTDKRIGQVAKMVLIFAPFQLLNSIVSLISDKPFDPIPLSMAMLCLLIALWDYLLFRRRWNSIVITVREFMNNVQPDRATEEDTVLLPANDDLLQTTQIDSRKLNSDEEPTSKLKV